MKKTRSLVAVAVLGSSFTGWMRLAKGVDRSGAPAAASPGDRAGLDGSGAPGPQLRSRRPRVAAAAPAPPAPHP